MIAFAASAYILFTLACIAAFVVVTAAKARGIRGVTHELLCAFAKARHERRRSATQ